MTRQTVLALVAAVILIAAAAAATAAIPPTAPSGAPSKDTKGPPPCPCMRRVEFASIQPNAFMSFGEQTWT